MNSKPYIILGEAQESDSEEEIDSSNILKDSIEYCKGKIISGEASESDEDNIGEFLFELYSLMIKKRKPF